MAKRIIAVFCLVLVALLVVCCSLDLFEPVTSDDEEGEELTAEECFKDIYIAEGNKWIRTSGGLEVTSPKVYKSFFNADEGFSAITIVSESSVYKIYDYDKECTTPLVLTVNSDYLSGKINQASGDPLTELTFALDNETDTMTVSYEATGKSVVFTLSEED